MAKEENIILPVIALGGILLLFSGGGNNGPLPHELPPGAHLTPTDFIKRYWADALASQKATTIPALFTITQGGIESNWGNSMPGNMVFGIKAGPTWTGATQWLYTHEIINGVNTVVLAKFRAYPSVQASFVDHGRFFIDNSRYKTALYYVSDPLEFARQVAKAGYATDPNYTQKITDAMKVVVGVLQRANLI